MREFSGELEQLQAEVVRLHKMRSVLESLSAEKFELIEQEKRLREIREKEQRDVDALGRVSLSSIISSIAGNKDEKLSQEQAEAYAAALKHDDVLRRLEQMEAETERTQREIDRLEGCEDRFQAAVVKRLEEMKNTGNPQSAEIYRLEERIGFLRQQQREIEEAMQAGNAALREIGVIEGSLNSAEGWGMYDMLGGGMLSTMIKNSHMDDAQAQIGRLQDLLSKFRTELSDIQVTADIQVQTDGFLRFADYFFDSFFVDWMVLDKINDTQNQVAGIKNQVQAVIQNLQQMYDGIEREAETLCKELEALAAGGFD